jgi:hypothetical protein
MEECRKEDILTEKDEKLTVIRRKKYRIGLKKDFLGED